MFFWLRKDYFLVFLKVILDLFEHHMQMCHQITEFNFHWRRLKLFRLEVYTTGMQARCSIAVQLRLVIRVEFCSTTNQFLHVIIAGKPGVQSLQSVCLGIIHLVSTHNFLKN